MTVLGSIDGHTVLTDAGSPPSGSFQAGDRAISLAGQEYICTVAGSPGTWTQVSGAVQPPVTSVAGRTGNVVLNSSDLGDFSSSVRAVANATYSALGQPAPSQALSSQPQSAAAILRPWYAALAQRHIARPDIVMIGDSIAGGQGPTALANTFVSRLAATLRSRYPVTGINGGKGLIQPFNLNVNTFTWPSSGTTSGENTDFGPARSTAICASTGQFLTVTGVSGTSYKVMYIAGPGNGTAFTRIDGGTAATWSTSAGSQADGQLTGAQALTAGTHSVDHGWISGGTVYMDGIVIYDGDETAGPPMVHNLGHYGWATTDWIGGGHASTQWPAAIAALTPKVIVITLGANDMSTGVTPATFQANISTLLGYIRAALSTPYPPVVLNMVYQRGGSYTYPWSQYVSAAYAAAVADGQCVVLDQGTRFPTAAADTLGLINASDHVHPTDKGAAFLAENLAALLSIA